VFCRVIPEERRGWICGYISRPKFLLNAKLLHAGEMEGNNNYRVKNDNYSLPISDLLPIEKINDPKIKHTWW
jgi:hypothetical protein